MCRCGTGFVNEDTPRGIPTNFFPDMGWATRVTPSHAVRHVKYAQGSWAHVSAVIGGEGLWYGRCADVRVSVPDASVFIVTL